MECNFTSQLGQLIKVQTGLDIEDKVLKYDGRPFFVEEVKEIIESRLNKSTKGGKK